MGGREEKECMKKRTHTTLFYWQVGAAFTDFLGQGMLNVLLLVVLTYG